MGRALLFLVFKQNLNPSYWHIWHIKNCQKWNIIEKVTTPKELEGVKNPKKQTTKCYQGLFPNGQKKSLYVALFLFEFVGDL
jgi:hypothetical protein